MTQKTCDIIMCCKMHRLINDEVRTPKDNVAAYLAQHSLCDATPLTRDMVNNALHEALYDYADGAENPSNILRQLLIGSGNTTDKIVAILAGCQVCESYGYVNGFTAELLRTSEATLGSAKNLPYLSLPEICNAATAIGWKVLDYQLDRPHEIHLMLGAGDKAVEICTAAENLHQELSNIIERLYRGEQDSVTVELLRGCTELRTKLETAVVM